MCKGFMTCGRQSPVQPDELQYLVKRRNFMAQAAALQAESAQRINTFLAQVYPVMTLGLLVTAIVST